MRHLRLRKWSQAAAFMAVAVIFNSSCKDDDPVLPDYAGTWITVKTVPSQSGYTQVKDLLTFTEKSFMDLKQEQTADNKWTDLESVQGSMTVYGNVMNVTVTEIGISSYSMLTDLPTGVITSYKKGTTEFDALITKMDQPKTFESKYSITDNKMTLQIDSNADGDYLDEFETSVYTKQ